MPAGGDADVAVIGAGVVGLGTAWALARRGVRVLLLERANGPALGASFANGAQLSYAYTDAMAGPALWKQLPGMLAGGDAAFRVRASLDPHFWAWGLALLRNATAARLQRNTLATLALALESKAAMDALLARHPIDFQHRVAGKLHVYYDASALPKARAMIDTKRSFGVRQQLLSPAEAIAAEPALADARGMVGAVHSPDEEAGDPWRFCCGLLQILQAQYGMQARFGFDLQRAQRDGTHWRLHAASGDSVRVGKVAVCAGIDSHALLRTLGLASPLMAIKGYSFTAPCGTHAPRASITDTARKLVFCRLGERIRVAGLADLNHWDPKPDPARMQQLIAMARDSLPEAADYEAIEHRWAGLRPATPPSNPVIRQPRDGLVLNIGHGMLGWTLAMGSGERAANLLLDAA
ncbi:FAD-dependent oxidoreductase [Thermomonas sp.]|jgi:D-amino-acid dehydrogenase|uniref:FAD-dependent oxidoreductase n=1 Tax=Thermomonas sp. TaxID=1971895 RepID=UPI00257A1C75|nr:FAD-dependent oxidoreductase [Thermomonas sp.]